MAAKLTNPPPMVSVNHVSMSFNQVEALKDISFNVAAGTIFGLVGSDGAGKSTLLRLIATMIKPARGEIYVDGFNVVTERRKVKNIIGYMPQRFGLYQDLTVEENMEFFMDIFNIPRSERKKRKEKYLGFSNLLSFVNRATGNLSGGMKQKLGLACVLVHEPKVLILDEPTNGVDPVSRREFWEILESMKKEGMTVLVSTAYLDEGELCDELALMHRAVIITAASPNKMRGDFENLEEAMIARIQEVDKDIEHDTFRF
ncbi:MAG TPA: ABC transporter ATP-binding protein [Smithellaceae bacterium]|jgi:ABC-2 type transport system ATP-binding protein|nr:ABC transporter ATP-binding protein [Syntrophaceae bacterium]NMD06149.1 ABC transporter ATP-binding protein [Deltaproteobacteria bacterium]HNQ19393.1 ABC transporter ATP-binding protein [Smithellaceae bacterium]MBP8609129.1 ABC transporter ATP-binding protein [Syntrophaceae bacterium]HOD31818.1 ABC transporter ATP-binding protein [Smithellaceae bacterium]